MKANSIEGKTVQQSLYPRLLAITLECMIRQVITLIDFNTQSPSDTVWILLGVFENKCLEIISTKLSFQPFLHDLQLYLIISTLIAKSLRREMRQCGGCKAPVCICTKFKRVQALSAMYVKNTCSRFQRSQNQCCLFCFHPLSLLIPWIVGDNLQLLP